MFDRRALHLARLTMLCLVLVSAALLYWQTARAAELSPLAVRPVWSAPGSDELTQDAAQAGQTFVLGVSQAMDLEQKPVPVVQRTSDLLKRIKRGAIYDREGRPLAFDRPAADGAWERFYTEPALAHTLGYVSGQRVGVTGLERTYNNTLFGLDRPDAQINQLLHRPIEGSDLTLTIDTTIQRAADSALRGQRGSIVVLEAVSGAVLAMASAPSFDPNRIHEEGYLDEILSQCDQASGCQGELINRASQSVYPPGSTWTTVALIAALDTGWAEPGTLFDFGEPLQGPDGPYYAYTVDGSLIPDPNHSEAQLDLEMSYARSANYTFAQIGDQLPPDTLIEYARRLGFGAPGQVSFPLEIEYAPSQIARDVDQLYSDNLLRATTGIGQGQVLASPLNMAMVVLAVLNEGTLPVPYLVEAVQEPSGYTAAPANHSQVTNIMQPQTARAVRQMMVTAVERGTSQAAAAAGLVAGGTTGAAPSGGSQAPHAWFAGFAEAGERAVVIVVMLENGGEGAQTAAPLFAEIARVALRQELEAAPAPQPAAAPTQPGSPPDPPEGQPTALPTAVPTATPTLAPTATPEPAATPTASPWNVPPPQIARDPGKRDITADNPSCGANIEVPEASGEFLWPSQYQALSGGNFREGHPGIDLSAPTGSPVYAADNGLVIFAGWTGVGYGNSVLIDHGNGYRTLYAHLSQVSTYCGARVQKGKIIGLSGNTGNSTGPHLHFEVRVPGGYIDPVDVLPVP